MVEDGGRKFLDEECGVICHTACRSVTNMSRIGIIPTKCTIFCLHLSWSKVDAGGEERKNSAWDEQSSKLSWKMRTRAYRNTLRSISILFHISSTSFRFSSAYAETKCNGKPSSLASFQRDPYCVTRSCAIKSSQHFGNAQVLFLYFFSPQMHACSGCRGLRRAM